MYQYTEYRAEIRQNTVKIGEVRLATATYHVTRVLSFVKCLRLKAIGTNGVDGEDGLDAIPRKD